MIHWQMNQTKKKRYFGEEAWHCSKCGFISTVKTDWRCTFLKIFHWKYLFFLKWVYGEVSANID